jgi:hypothetical protein
MRVRVYCEQERILEYDIHEDSWTIGKLKQEVQKEIDQHQRKFLRLIFRGQVLQNDDMLISELNNSSESILIFHASLGHHSSTGSIGNNDEQARIEEPAIGFARLRSAGLSETEIEDMRRNFHRFNRFSSGAAFRNDVDLETGEIEPQQPSVTTSNNAWTREQLMAEEAWMEDLSAAEGLSASFLNNQFQTPGQDEDNLDPYFEWSCSILLGFFCGILSMVLVQRKYFQFSTRQQAGIVVGMLMNVLYAVLQSILG